MKNSIFAATTLLMLATTSPASAAYVVDTGTPVSNLSAILSQSQSLAGYFTLGSDTIVSGVEGFIFGSNAASVGVTIYSDAALPSAANMLFTASFAPVTPAIHPGQWQGIQGQSWALAAGNYWVSFSTNGSLSMRFLAPNPLTKYAFSDNANWTESARNLALGIRITGGAVPEPASWAMMIAGFGLVGGMMRRRVTKVSYA